MFIGCNKYITTGVFIWQLVCWSLSLWVCPLWLCRQRLIGIKIFCVPLLSHTHGLKNGLINSAICYLCFKFPLHAFYQQIVLMFKKKIITICWNLALFCSLMPWKRTAKKFYLYKHTLQQSHLQFNLDVSQDIYHFIGQWCMPSSLKLRHLLLRS
jgi:hypothetical protein